MGLFRCRGEMRLLCSLRASSPFLSYWALYGREQHNRQILWDRGWQVKQVSKLVDRAACWVIAVPYWHLVTRGKDPPTVSHISAKWITDKSAGAHCSPDLTTSLRPHCSQVTSAWLCWEIKHTHRTASWEENAIIPPNDAVCLEVMRCYSRSYSTGLVGFKLTFVVF